MLTQLAKALAAVFVGFKLLLLFYWWGCGPNENNAAPNLAIAGFKYMNALVTFFLRESTFFIFGGAQNFPPYIFQCF